jgi:hypothetical protein
MSLREEANSYKRVMAEVRARALADAEAAVREALGRFCRDRNAFVLNGPAGMVAAGVAAVRALVPEQEGASEALPEARSADTPALLSPHGGEREKALEECAQIAWDEAERQLALYDAGEDTYGHHAAEFIAKAIRSLSTSSGE